MYSTVLKFSLIQVSVTKTQKIVSLWQKTLHAIVMSIKPRKYVATFVMLHSRLSLAPVQNKGLNSLADQEFPVRRDPTSWGRFQMETFFAKIRT